MNLLTLDIEFNKPSNNIIQIGYVIGDLKTGKVLEKIRRYVKINENISEFIIKLTGVTNELCKNGNTIEEIYEEMSNLHKKYNCFRNPLTWGGGDSESLRKALCLDDDNFLFGRRWIDVKTLFISYQLANDNKIKSGLARSLTKLNLKFEGKKHDALDDAYNTFIIYRELLNRIKDKHEQRKT